MLEIQRTQTEAETVQLSLAGVVDERSDLSPLTAVTSGTLILDLAGVSRINSFGVGRWISAMQELSPDVVVRWDGVSTVMVAQLNMIANFAGPAEIRSFYAPYFCGACDAERAVLLERAGLTQPRAPKEQCPECGGALEFDDLEEDYLGGLLAR
ncbi:MAG: hypothetical protein ACI9WU_000559 [Myxococcota bacterium]|jgi:hypothetical protein